MLSKDSKIFPATKIPTTWDLDFGGDPVPSKTVNCSGINLVNTVLMDLLLLD